MGIRVVHQPGAITGLAGYASGYGKANERERNRVLDLYKDERKRMDRIAMQQRGFMFQGAMEGQRHQWDIDKEERGRKQALEDVNRDRAWEEADVTAGRAWDESQAEQAHKDRMAQDKARIGSQFEYASDLDEQQRERDRRDERRSGRQQGEISYDQKTEDALNDLEYKRGLVTGSSLQEEEKAEALEEIKRREDEIYSSSTPKKPLTLDEDFAKNVRIEGGRKYVKDSSDVWQRMRGDEDPQDLDRQWEEREQKRMEARGKSATSIMGEKDAMGAPIYGDYNAALEEAQKRQTALEATRSPRPSKATEPEMMGVGPEPEMMGVGPEPEMMGMSPEAETGVVDPDQEWMMGLGPEPRPAGSMSSGQELRRDSGTGFKNNAEALQGVKGMKSGERFIGPDGKEYRRK